MRSLSKYLAAVLGLLALTFACVSSQGGAGVDRDIVLDTSSPDEPVLSFAPDMAPAAVGTYSNFLRATDSNQVLAGRTYRGTSYTGPIVVSSGKETLTNIEYRRWNVVNDIAAGGQAKWGILLYNEVNCRYVNVNVLGIKAEHGIYQHSPRGDVLLSFVVVYDVGAQGFQQTWRGAETTDPLGWQKTGTHRLEHCVFRKCGQPRGYGRASYAVSMFGWQSGGGSTPRQFWDCPVELVDVSIEHDSQGQYELRGALLVEWRPSLTVIGGRTEYIGQSDRDLWHIHEVDVVYVENSFISGPAGKFVDFDGCDEVTFTSPNFDGGDAVVRIDGQIMGTTDDEIVWKR
jgi:hypothetical protein